MSYTSLNFAYFVAIVASVYFLFPVKKYQWTVLLAASYVFYLFTGFKFAAFLITTTATTYAAALVIDNIASKAKAELKAHKADWDKQQKKEFKERIGKKKRVIMLCTVILNLGILAFLKYFNFLAGSLNDLLSGTSLSIPTLKLFLPLGISFYTFQSVGYLVDVYREKISAERNPAKLALFVSYFPQIIQGPISFYDQLAHQLYEPHSFNFTRLKYGCELILWGLVKKVVIADRAIMTINAVVDAYTDYSGTTILFALILYALQLYADFSGGIDISRGVSQILGIDMIQNFRRPYFALTIDEYWRRWHISLGAWMKEYVFYPIALSKRFTGVTKKIRGTKFGSTTFGAHVAKVLPTSFASLIVFLLVGIWHGASWKYVAFGLWNGGVIMLSTLLEPAFLGINKSLRIRTESFFFRLFQMGRTFVIVLIGYVFDIAPSFRAAMEMFAAMITRQNIRGAMADISVFDLTKKDYLVLILGVIVMFFVSLIQEKNPDTTLRQLLDRKPFILRYLLILVAIMVLLVFGIYGPGFNPAEFVYMQF